MPAAYTFNSALENEFKLFIAGETSAPFSQPDSFAGAVLFELCKMYHARGWVQQFHLGPIRNNNSRLLTLLGADAGVDSMGDYPQAVSLSNFLNGLDGSNQLAKTILYNLNPADNELMATMCGNFSDGTTKGKMQYGSGWWFLDQKDGIEKQLNALSNMGVVSNFIGMITDSRSFLSFSRHDFFRRILCNLFGQEMENGLLPNDEVWIGEIIKDICYYNAKNYFNF
jgi:glucuronate isomerase